MRSWIFRNFTKVISAFRPIRFAIPRFNNIKTTAVASSTGIILASVFTYQLSSLKTNLLHTKEENTSETFITIKGIKVVYNKENLKQEKDAKNKYEQILKSLKDENLDMRIQLRFIEGDIDRSTAQVFLETQGEDIKISHKKLDMIRELITQKTTIKKAETLYDVTSYLKQTNKGLFDSTIIFFCKDTKWAELLSKPSEKEHIERLLRDHNGLIRISSTKLAKKMKLEKNTFYKYYKPSFINGHGNYQHLNIEYWQAISGQCRNVLIREGNDYKEIFTTKIYFKRNWKGLPQSGRPVVCIYWNKNSIIWPFTDQITKLARKYVSECDFIFSDDKSAFSKHFNMSEVEESFPYIFLVDGDNRIPVKSPFTGKEIGSYPSVYSDICPIMLGIEDASKFLDDYFEGKLKHLPQSKRMYRYSPIKILNKEKFESEVLNNDKIKQCLIQIYKHNCASCFFNSKSFDALAWKFQKYGLWNNLKLFKLRTDNDIPQLGTFPYTPMYIYIKKGDTPETKNQIVEIFTLESPQKFDLFKEQLSECSGLDLSKIKMDPRLQFEKYIKKEDKLEGFDFDFDRDTPPQPKKQEDKNDNEKNEDEENKKEEVKEDNTESK